MSEQYNWNAALNGSMMNNPRMLQNQQAYDNIRNIENIGNQQRAQQSQMRNIANAAAFMSARDNGGMMSPDLRATLTETLGQPVLGGVDLPDGGFAYLGPSQSEQGKIGIIGRVDALTRLKILQDAQLGDRTIGQQKALWGMLSKKYTPEQMASAGIHDPNTAWSVGPAVQVGGSENYKNSQNGNLSTSKMSDSGARPGPRRRFWGEDDFNGTPLRDEDRPGHRYLGHGISTFSTTDWKEDREEKREPNGHWVETAVGPSDTFNGGVGLKEGEKADNSQVRTYKNTKTGEVVRVKDGETPPWRKDPISDRLKIAEMNERGRNERNAANNDAKNERASFYGNSREKQAMLKWYDARMKECDKIINNPTAKKEDKDKAAAEKAQIQSYINSLMGMRASDENDTPAPDPTSGTDILNKYKGQKHTPGAIEQGGGTGGAGGAGGGTGGAGGGNRKENPAPQEVKEEDAANSDENGQSQTETAAEEHADNAPVGARVETPHTDYRLDDESLEERPDATKRMREIGSKMSVATEEEERAEEARQIAEEYKARKLVQDGDIDLEQGEVGTVRKLIGERLSINKDDEKRAMEKMTPYELKRYNNMTDENRRKAYVQRFLKRNPDGTVRKAVGAVGDMIHGGTDKSDFNRAWKVMTNRGRARYNSLTDDEKERYIQQVLKML